MRISARGRGLYRIILNREAEEVKRHRVNKLRAGRDHRRVAACRVCRRARKVYLINLARWLSRRPSWRAIKAECRNGMSAAWRALRREINYGSNQSAAKRNRAERPHRQASADREERMCLQNGPKHRGRNPGVKH